jgi:hypothetical protein
MKPTIGRIVHYVVTAADAQSWNEQQADKGTQNPLGEGDHLAALVVKDWSDVTVNLQVFSDGAHSYWKTSITNLGDTQPGTWHWPEREDA